MADELTPSRSESLPTDLTPALPGDSGTPAITAIPPATRGTVIAPEAPALTGEGAAHRSELSLLLGWCFGAVLVGFSGWGLWALAYFVTRYFFPGSEAPVELVMLTLSLSFFFLLERNFWLSRLMGLYVRPGTRPWQSAFMLWLLGMPGLLFRSTAPPPASPAPSTTPPEGKAEEQAPPIPWSSWLLNLGAQFVFALLLAVFMLVVLWATGMSPQAAGGTAVIVAILVTSFVRHFIRWPLPKEAFARDSRLPPNVRPSDSSGREVVETVVFVVVLVLLLKSFAAEAFVIPTGSMAETLYGYQKDVKCPSCKITFPVNCSNEVDPQDDTQRTIVNGCTCPNCRQAIRLVDPKRDDRQPRPGAHHPDGEYMEILDPGWSSGDRVLVGKFFDLVSGMRSPHRLDVVVFKYPEGPQKNHVAMNYIKRLIGLPGETIAIWGGDLYV
ncbi:MAG TPA: S26 family signal peptidase, partial [Gemmataceae bacterium]|nr:S26 family signal peptidase [Gemmataceae bacterium]